MEFSGKTTNKVIIESFVDKHVPKHEKFKWGSNFNVYLFYDGPQSRVVASCSFSLKSDKDGRYALLGERVEY